MNPRRLVLMLCSTAAVAALALASPNRALAGRGNGPTGTIYVVGQDLFYDTMTLTDLPPGKGPFQDLFVFLDADGNIAMAMTDFGPGDPGYLGGRWKAYIYDVDGNLVDTHYFECPLLPPGYTGP